MGETVWLAYYGYNYEGASVVGIFETKQSAEARLGRLDSMYGDFRDVEEIEIGDDVDIQL